MSLTSEAVKSGLPKPWPDLERLALMVSHVTRLKMLRELSLGEVREIRELAQVAGCSYDLALKHLGLMARAGLVARGRGKVYLIPPQFLPVAGERVVDYGWVLLRLEEVQ